MLKLLVAAPRSGRRRLLFSCLRYVELFCSYFFNCCGGEFSPRVRRGSFQRRCLGGTRGLKRSWGETGGKCLGIWGERDSLGISQQKRRTGDRRFLGVTAALLCDLGVNPFERKAEKREFARWREGVLPRRRSHSRVVSISNCCNGNGGTKLAREMSLLLEVRANWSCNSSTRVFRMARSVVGLKPLVKGKSGFWPRECSLIF